MLQRVQRIPLHGVYLAGFCGQYKPGVGKVSVSIQHGKVQGCLLHGGAAGFIPCGPQFLGGTLRRVVGRGVILAPGKQQLVLPDTDDAGQDLLCALALIDGFDAVFVKAVDGKITAAAVRAEQTFAVAVPVSIQIKGDDAARHDTAAVASVKIADVQKGIVCVADLVAHGGAQPVQLVPIGVQVAGNIGRILGAAPKKGRAAFLVMGAAAAGTQDVILPGGGVDHGGKGIVRVIGLIDMVVPTLPR